MLAGWIWAAGSLLALAPETELPTTLPLLPIMDKSYPASWPGTTLGTAIPAELFPFILRGSEGHPSFSGLHYSSFACIRARKTKQRGGNAAGRSGHIRPPPHSLLRALRLMYRMTTATLPGSQQDCARSRIPRCYPRHPSVPRRTSVHPGFSPILQELRRSVPAFAGTHAPGRAGQHCDLFESILDREYKPLPHNT